jgi:glucoamylase
MFHRQPAQALLGQNVFIAGQLTQLGNWSPTDAKPLSADKYTSSDPLWYAEIDLPAGTVFEYKYIKKTSDGTVTWENDPNNRQTTPSECGSTLTLNDTWR